MCVFSWKKHMGNSVFLTAMGASVWLLYSKGSQCCDQWGSMEGGREGTSNQHLESKHTRQSFSFFFFRDRCSTMELQLPWKYFEVDSVCPEHKTCRVTEHIYRTSSDTDWLVTQRGGWWMLSGNKMILSDISADDTIYL